MLSAAFIPRSETSSSGHPVKHLDADGEASFSINCFEPLLSISTWLGSAAGLWLTNRHSSRQPARRGCMCSQTLHIPPLPTYLNINSIIIIITAQKLPPFFKLWHQAQGVDQLNRASVRWSVAVSSSFNRRPPPFQTRLPWRAAACQNAIKNWNPFLHPFCFQRWRPRSECKPKGTHMMFRCHHAGIPGLTEDDGGGPKLAAIWNVYQCSEFRLANHKPVTHIAQVSIDPSEAVPTRPICNATYRAGENDPVLAATNMNGKKETETYGRALPLAFVVRLSAKVMMVITATPAMMMMGHKQVMGKSNGLGPR